MRFFRYLAAVTLTGQDKTVTFRKGFVYLKPALKWIFQWTDRSNIGFCDVYDSERQNPCWNSRDGLLLEYRTVAVEDAPAIVNRKRLRKVA